MTEHRDQRFVPTDTYGRSAGAAYATPPDEPRQPYGPADEESTAALPPGSPPPPAGSVGSAGSEQRRTWTVRHTAVAAVAAAAVAVGGGVALAASGDGTAASAQGGPGGGGFGTGRGGPMGAASGLVGALHGEFTVADSTGAAVTRLLQTGDVTAVSTTSITVQSTDGYTATYSIAPSTTVDNGQDAISAVATGHTVTVVAAADKAAVTITDQDLAAALGGGPGTGQQGGGVPPGGAVPPGGTTGQQGTTG